MKQETIDRIRKIYRGQRLGAVSFASKPCKIYRN